MAQPPRTQPPAQQTALATNNAKPKSLSPVDQYRRTLVAMRQQFELAIPRGIMKPDRLIRVVITALQNDPNLLKCDQRTVISSVIQAAQLGLEPNTALGHAYLVPYSTRCQLILGYRGMIDLARRSDQIVSISARIVRAGDQFEYEYGLDEVLKHKPAQNPRVREPLTHTYAVARLKGGGVQFEVLTRQDIEETRRNAKAGGDRSPWATSFDEMAKKTAVRRLYKMLPVSLEAARAAEHDAQAEAGEIPAIDFGEDSAPIDVEASPVDQPADGERVSMRQPPIEVRSPEPPAAAPPPPEREAGSDDGDDDRGDEPSADEWAAQQNAPGTAQFAAGAVASPAAPAPSQAQSVKRQAVPMKIDGPGK